MEFPTTTIKIKEEVQAISTLLTSVNQDHPPPRLAVRYLHPSSEVEGKQRCFRHPHVGLHHMSLR